MVAWHNVLMQHSIACSCEMATWNLTEYIMTDETDSDETKCWTKKSFCTRRSLRYHINCQLIISTWHGCHCITNQLEGKYSNPSRHWWHFFLDIFLQIHIVLQVNGEIFVWYRCRWNVCWNKSIITIIYSEEWGNILTKRTCKQMQKKMTSDFLLTWYLYVSDGRVVRAGMSVICNAFSWSRSLHSKLGRVILLSRSYQIQKYKMGCRFINPTCYRLYSYLDWYIGRQSFACKLESILPVLTISGAWHFVQLCKFYRCFCFIMSWLRKTHTPKFDPAWVRTHDLWITTEHLMPLRRFRPHSHQCQPGIHAFFVAMTNSMPVWVQGWEKNYIIIITNRHFCCVRRTLKSLER